MSKPSRQLEPAASLLMPRRNRSQQWRRKLSQRERQQATAGYLASPHPPIVLDSTWLVCRCSAHPDPHGAHLRELKEFEK